MSNLLEKLDYEAGRWLQKFDRLVEDPVMRAKSNAYNAYNGQAPTAQRPMPETVKPPAAPTINPMHEPCAGDCDSDVVRVPVLRKASVLDNG